MGKYHLIILMAIGFGATTTSNEDTIRSLQKSTFLRNEEIVDLYRDKWNRIYPARIFHSFSEQELFSPREYCYHNLNSDRACLSSDCSSPSSTGETRIIREFLRFGFWSLTIEQTIKPFNPERIKEWELTIAVWCGNRRVFHPQQAKNNILAYHDQSVYERWKQIVLADLDNFAEVLRVFNPMNHIYSVACSASSERVCKRLNLEVRNGIAFLLHEKGKVCQHKSGAFMPST
ncbi:hypothetical protein [Synechococcus sp. CBW1004]|uniref:hypothetical protein n=1 Tax=Synechococcus sp. CBW1004 TaxID=1353136 RepID=UPI001E2C70F3|nr:hypothetical protein [Synechococcus sp. CBW1004]